MSELTPETPSKNPPAPPVRGGEAAPVGVKEGKKAGNDSPPDKPEKGLKKSSKKVKGRKDRTSVTPMMEQYFHIKQAHPGCLLFYRMGDFYELFFDDAVAAAAALDITLTRRGKHEGEDIPMCGVPVHSHDSYLAKLIRKGFKVAVAEQTEDPAAARKRGGKALVRRDVVRVVTAGTLTEDTLLDARSHNYLAALAEVKGEAALAWLDISTGDFRVQDVARAEFAAALARFEPKELLVCERLLSVPELYELFNEWKDVLTPLADSRFDSTGAKRRLENLYGVKALDAFGAFSRAGLSAAGAVVDYVELTQKGRLPRLAPPQPFACGSVLEVDPATMRNLELFQTLSGARDGSLLHTVDATLTGAGARLLAAHLTAPLTDVAAIARRLHMVGFFVENGDLRGRIREVLRHCPDMERALSRLTLGRGGPRDLAAIREALEAARELYGLLAEAAAETPQGISELASGLAPGAKSGSGGGHGVLIERLGRALAAELPLGVRDGGFIAPGYAPELDELRTLRDESKRLIAALQGRYGEETGIASLKVRHNNVLGYFVEVTATQGGKMPEGPESPFIHRQTMTSATRYTTTELADLESRITSAADKALALEIALFEDLVGEVTAHAEPIASTAAALAGLDVATANGEMTVIRRYCRPQVDDSFDFEIKSGRHPVVEAALETETAAPFVPNDCDLAQAQRLWLLTGPNMAGKSTFLRQNALIAVMAHAGLFVPAESARMGVVDRLFSRVGAADDLARGRSTFMVEMVETAAILHRAGPRSLVILDEIGRGTATYDGLSIAWACVEHLHDVNGARTLFATHYHELTALAASLKALCLHTMRVKDWQGEVVFLHEVAPGVAKGSYGIHVAELAGLLPAVVTRARQVLGTLEQGEQSGALNRLADDLPLFSAVPATPDIAPALSPSVLEVALDGVNPDHLSPKEAMELLYRLKELMAEEP